MKLLVTGGAGFIGSNFINYWFSNYPDDKITNLDLLTYAGNLDNTVKFKDNKNYKFVQGNICDKDAVEEVISDVDVVVHFAAESHVDRSIEDPYVFLKTNVFGTNVLLDAALNNKLKRFHHISTDEVFGELELDSTEKFSEETPYSPRNPYSATKAASDHLVRSYFHTYELPITITNCSNNFGPNQGIEKFISRAITNAIENKPIKIYGDGKYVRDWLFVEDHCAAIDNVLRKGRIGETYLVGGMTDEINNLEIAEIILEILGKPKELIEFVTDRPGHDRRYAVNWSKINTELGWKPQAEFNDRLKNTVDWYKDNEWHWKLEKNKVESFYEKIKR